MRERRFYASVRPTDLFIVYFPRSGGFWLQMVLAELRKTSAEPLRYEDIESHIPNLNTKHYFNRIPLDEFAGLSPPRIFKVHAPPDPQLRRVIFLVRDPRDAFLSYCYYIQWAHPDFALPLDLFLLKNPAWPMDWNA